MYHAYNSTGYQMLYKKAFDAWVRLDKERNVEPQLRDLCNLIFVSGLGVTRYSCDGHGQQGYIMIMAKDSESFLILINVFQQIAAWLLEKNGYDRIIHVESDVAVWGTGPDMFPTLVVRGPENYWSFVTQMFKKINI